MWVSVGSLIWATVQFQPVRQNINLTTDLALTKEMRDERKTSKNDFYKDGL